MNLISITEDIGKGPVSAILKGVFAGLNEFYSKELAQKVTYGMTENAEKGLYNGSYRTFGYDIEKGRYVVNPDEARVVQKIFEMYSEGKTVKNIIDFCNDRGYKTPQSRDFGYNFIDRLLKNEKYIGIYSWKDIQVPDIIEAIVQKDVFNKVQKRLEENSNSGARAKAIEDYALVGKVFCGLCEQPMVADSVKKPVKTGVNKVKFDYTVSAFNRIGSSIFNSLYSKEESKEYKRYRYYKCRGQKQKAHKNGCTKKTVTKDTLENAVISYTANQYLSDKNLDELAKAIYKEQGRVKSNSNLAEINRTILECKRMIENLYVMVESGHFSDSTFKRILEHETKMKDYELEREQILSETKKLKHEDIREQLYIIKQKMQKYIKDGEIPIEVKKAFCDTFIDKVYVFDEDDGGNRKNKKMKVTIVFDAMESEDLLGFDEAEIEISSIFTSVGSPNKKKTLLCLLFIFLNSTGIEA